MATNIQMLKEAYEWEQARLQAWADEMANHPGANTPIIREFIRIWKDYFNEIQSSNRAVIDICDAAIAARESEASAATMINTDVHNRDILGVVKGATVETCTRCTARAETSMPTSRYFEALDKTIDLELLARDKIENFLNTGRP